MKKLSLLIIPLALLVGCAQTWYKPTAKAGDFEKDRYDCLQQSQQQFSAAQTNGWQGAAVSKTVTNDGLFGSCMNARGWSLQNKQALEGQLQQQQASNMVSQNQAQSEIQRLKGMREAICANPSLKAYYDRSPCNAGDPTFAQLADSSKITSTQKAALLKQRDAVADYQKQQTAVNQGFGGRAAKISAAAELDIVPKNDQNNLDLYNGKITWGEYNQRRKDIYLKFQERAKSIQQLV